MDPLTELVEGLDHDASRLDIVEAVMAEIGKSMTPENLASEALALAKALATHPETVDAGEVSDFLYILAERIQDREDELINSLRKSIKDLVYEVAEETILDRTGIYENVAAFFEAEAEARAEDLGSLPETILDPHGFCPYCGLNYVERAESDAEVINMAVDAARTKRELRELELVLAETEVVARRRLDAEAEKDKGVRRRSRRR